MSTDWNRNKLTPEEVERVFEVLGVEKGTEYVFEEDEDDD